MTHDTMERPEVADELVDVADISGGAPVVKLNRTEAALAELRADLAGKTYDLTTTAGDKAARADRLRCVTLRTTLEKRRKELKAPALDFGRKIDAAAERINAAILALEAPIDSAIQADERRRAEEKAARERAEAERLQALRDTVDQMLGKWTARAMAPDMTAARIEAGIEAFGRVSMPDELRDVAAHWDIARRGVAAELERLHAKAAQREEAARLEAQRLENERIAAEQRAEAERQAVELARQRQELEEKAAAVRAEAERLAAVERQMRVLDQAEDQAMPNQQPAAEAPDAQQEVARNLLQTQPGSSPFLPGDASVDSAGAEAVAAADEAPAIDVQPVTMKLSDINHRLAPIHLSVEALRQLGFLHIGIDRAARLYHESDWPRIKAALIAHITNLH